MAKKIREPVQFAALPYRIDPNGQLQVMLQSSRETRRWVIPKGWPMKGKEPYEVAAQEALEEAGLVGHIVSKHPVGVFHYLKRLAADSVLCEVHVFLFCVDQQLDDWPEKGQRETKWFDPDTAADLVDEGWLAEIVRAAFAQSVPQKRRRRTRTRLSASRLTNLTRP